MGNQTRHANTISFAGPGAGKQYSNLATQPAIFLNSVSSSDSCTPSSPLQEEHTYLVTYAFLPLLCYGAQIPFRYVDKTTEASLQFQSHIRHTTQSKNLRLFSKGLQLICLETNATLQTCLFGFFVLPGC